jgi:hypothetical protein
MKNRREVAGETKFKANPECTVLLRNTHRFININFFTKFEWGGINLDVHYIQLFADFSGDSGSEISAAAG